MKNQWLRITSSTFRKAESVGENGTVSNPSGRKWERFEFNIFSTETHVQREGKKQSEIDEDPKLKPKGKTNKGWGHVKNPNKSRLL